MTLYAEVVLPLPLNKSFIYKLPEKVSSSPQVGSRVLVPFRNRKLTGFIIRIRKKSPRSNFRLKMVSHVLDERPVFSVSFLSFTRKLSRYYHTSWGELLQLSLPPSFILRTRKLIGLTGKGREVLQNNSPSKEEKKLLSFIQKKAYSENYLKRRTQINHFSSLISRLERKGWIDVEEEMKKVPRRKTEGTLPRENQLEMDFSLDKEALRRAEQMEKFLGEDVFSPYYVYGNMERREGIYFYLIKKCLDEGRKVIFLVPEISLTPSFTEKLEKRLGRSAALFHSGLTEKKRELEWQKVKRGESQVVIGSRSAILSPLENVGLIVVDGEHDSSYYPKETPCYDVRKGAWIRAKQEKSVLVYGSASPSVEELYKARKRGYLVKLRDNEWNKKAHIVKYKKGRKVFSSQIIERIRERLKNREPVLVFYNRRGYANYLICPRCQYIPRCRNCDVALDFHKREHKLVCHYCSYSYPSEDLRCPHCRSRIIQKRGLGIEAVQEELEKKFPRKRIEIFTTDEMKNKKKRGQTLIRYQKGDIDILIGTEIMAHQVHLSKASLLVILYPEILLTLPDFMASQKTFQTITQLRRFLHPKERSEMIIQTEFPDHFSISTAAQGDYEFFYQQEIQFRRLMNYPPFSYMAEILISGESKKAAGRESRKFISKADGFSDQVEILGPSMGSVPRVRGKTRVQIVLKAHRKKILDQVMRETLPSLKSGFSVRVYG
ncbi:primosomal protein N' [bacterium]|nr:primosomal protein N' [bacterium]